MQVCEVKIFLLDISLLADLQPYECYLSAGEEARCRQFVRFERRNQFLAGRMLLRQSLSQLLDIPFKDVQLTEQKGNAPRFDWSGNPEIGFSLSHSGNWVACAVSTTAKLGLDIELLNADRDLPELALHAFDTEENAWLNRQDATNRVRDFYQLWTRKEAQFKLNLPPVQCVHLPHPALSITLCSDRQLASPPQLVCICLSAEQTPEPVPYPR